MSTAVATLGTIIRRNGDPIAQIQDIEGPALTTDTDEITNHSSPDGVEEFIPTIKRTGEVTFPCVFLYNDPTHDHLTGLRQAWDDRELGDYELEYPDGTGEQFQAYVTGLEMSAPVDGHLSADVTLRVTGAPTPVLEFAS